MTFVNRLSSWLSHSVSALLPQAPQAVHRISRALDVFMEGVESLNTLDTLDTFDTRVARESVLDRIPGLDRYLDPETIPLLKALLAAPAEAGSERFTTMPPSDFQYFVQKIPHLFQNGLAVLEWLRAAGKGLEALSPGKNETAIFESLRKNIKAFQTLVQTASVTAPCDLWLMRQILSTHKKMGILEDLKRGFTVASYAAAKNLESKQLEADLDFLHSRRCIERVGDRYFARPGMLDAIEPLPDEFRVDWTGRLCAWFQKSPEADEAEIRRWLTIPRGPSVPGSGWNADLREIEIGYRLLSLVLALKESGRLGKASAGEGFEELLPEMKALLEEAGVLKNGKLTSLGRRVLEKGHGAFGIIGTYHGYLNHHEELLRAGGQKPHVERAKNIIGSRDANRPAFEEIAKSLKKFFDDRGDRPRVIIEHAAGLGIGLQECRKVFGDEGMNYVAADLEEKSLEGAKRERDAGRLSGDTLFVESNIGEPEKFIESLIKNGIDPQGAVVIVGNGFHEARGVSDGDMIRIFETLRKAGIILVFVEETGLSTAQLRRTAWNTYNAGFRWVHETSGQLLRPAVDDGTGAMRRSWASCVTEAGFRILEEYSRRTRRIMPCDLPPPVNPWISVTLFCAPESV